MEFLQKPSIGFDSVRDMRRSLPLYVDIDLTIPRSISAGTALILNIAGNSFYVDSDISTVGNAVVHFQDTTLSNASAPFFVSAGFIANVPFTQVLIENVTQSGKRMRIFYGVDIDFQAGVNSNVSISGNFSQNYNAQYHTVNHAPMTAGQTNIMSNANYLQNTKGVIVHGGAFYSVVPIAQINTHKMAYGFFNGSAGAVSNVRSLSDMKLTAASATHAYFHGTITSEGFIIPAGFGLQLVSDTAETQHDSWIAYTVL